MRVLLAVALAGLLAGASPAADVKYSLNEGNTKVTFVGTKDAGKHDGGFEKVSGTATVDDKGDATTLKVNVEVATSSLWADDKKLTGHLKSADFFNVKKYPKVTFVSTKVEKDGADYKVTGKLTLLGKTKEITVPAKISAARSLQVSSTFKINRSEFGMTYGKGKVHDEVTISVEVDTKK